MMVMRASTSAAATSARSTLRAQLERGRSRRRCPAREDNAPAAGGAACVASRGGAARGGHAAAARRTGCEGEAGDEAYMRMAMAAAREAFALGEVPVGAVTVHEHSGTILATAHNETERRMDPTAHAEMLCLRRAALHPMLEPLGGWRGLRECTLYVTLEPCAMCAGAALQSRVGRLVYGARSRLLGAHGGWVSLLPGSYSSPALGGETARAAAPAADGGWRPHPFTPDVPVAGGVLADECGEMMVRFFRERSRGRANGENAAVPERVDSVAS